MIRRATHSCTGRHSYPLPLKVIRVSTGCMRTFRPVLHRVWAPMVRFADTGYSPAEHTRRVGFYISEVWYRCIHISCKQTTSETHSDFGNSSIIARMRSPFSLASALQMRHNSLSKFPKSHFPKRLRIPACVANFSAFAQYLPDSGRGQIVSKAAFSRPLLSFLSYTSFFTAYRDRHMATQIPAAGKVKTLRFLPVFPTFMQSSTMTDKTEAGNVRMTIINGISALTRSDIFPSDLCILINS